MFLIIKTIKTLIIRNKIIKTIKTFHSKKLLIHVGKRVIIEILNVKGLNLSSLLATPDVFKLQV